MIGAINGEQLTATIDSLETGVDKLRVKQGLAQAWGAHNAEEARAVLDWLLGEGHRIHFDEVMRLYTEGETSDDDKIGEWLKNLEGALPLVRTSGLTGEAPPPHGILAWDMGRAVNVARLAFDAGYLTRAEAWNAINDAAAHARQAFGSWRDLAASYMVGRAMWGGTGVMLDGLIVVAQGLLEDDESPWQHVAWTSAESTRVMKR